MAATNGKGPRGGPTKSNQSYAGPVSASKRQSEAVFETWRQTDTTELGTTVAHLTKIGGGILLGATREGTGVNVTLFYDDDRQRFYPHGSDELLALLLEIQAWASSDDPSWQYWR